MVEKAECGGVLIPDGTRHCYVEERGVRDRVYKNGLRRFQLTEDHYVPRSMGGADGPTHLVHHYCQAVQGALCQPREGKVKGGRIAGQTTKEQGLGIHTPEMQAKGKIVGQANKELGRGWFAPGAQAKAGRIGGRVQKEQGLGIHAPEMAGVGLCVRWNIRRGKPCVCGRHV